MTVDQAYIPRFVTGFAALLLATTCTVTSHAAGSGASELTYGIGKVFHTSLSDAHLLAELRVPGKEPILVFSGRPSAPCMLPACDSASNVYFEWASNGAAMWGARSLSYPGDYYDSDARTLLARVRMYIGQCVDSREVVVWFTEAVDERAAQPDSALRTHAEVDAVFDPKLPGVPTSTSTPMLSSQFPEHLDISVTRSAVARHVCREIPPRAKLYTTAAAYVMQPVQFRTDCNSPAPAQMPLGRGRPGKPLAYRDKRTNILLYVESDGRHLAAVSPKGELLWVRDPFVDRNLCPYRTARPVIVYVGPTSWSGDETSIAKIFKVPNHLVEIRFDSSQFGVVDITNGEFFFVGQN